MKRFPIFLPAFLALALVTPSTLAQKVDVRGVSRGTFQGWSDVLIMESKDTAAKAVLAPNLGGRILSYGLHNENILWTNPNAAGQLYKPGDAPFDPGGFVCAIGPEVASLPDHPLTLLGEYSWSTKKKAFIALKGPEDKAIGVEMEKEIAYDPATGELGFVHRIKNILDRDLASCFWHRIACQPGGFALFPVNKKSRFSPGWAIRQTENGKITYDGTKPESAAVQVLNGVLVARTGGSATKIGADSDAQWLAYAHGRTLFIIHFPYYSGAVYSEAGNSVAVSWDETKTELQPMGAEARLRPRKSYEFPMKWSLVELPAEVTTHEQARALADKVPSSPFL
jgi:hypothetical protein